MKKKQLDTNQVTIAEREDTKSKKQWHKPKLEDVSGKVMAQPYIRFT